MWAQQRAPRVTALCQLHDNFARPLLPRTPAPSPLAPHLQRRLQVVAPSRPRRCLPPLPQLQHTLQQRAGPTAGSCCHRCRCCRCRAVVAGGAPPPLLGRTNGPQVWQGWPEQLPRLRHRLQHLQLHQGRVDVGCAFQAGRHEAGHQAAPRAGNSLLAPLHAARLQPSNCRRQGSVKRQAAAAAAAGRAAAQLAPLPQAEGCLCGRLWNFGGARVGLQQVGGPQMSQAPQQPRHSRLLGNALKAGGGGRPAGQPTSRLAGWKLGAKGTVRISAR